MNSRPPTPIEQAVTEKLKTGLNRLKCPRHPFRSIQKICKHFECRGRQRLCSLCISDHDMTHFSFVEDIESVLQPSSVRKLSDLSDEISRRIAKQSIDKERDRLMSCIVHRFEKLFEESKDRLIECLIKTSASLKNKQMESKLIANKETVARKHQLLIETRGDDLNFLEEYLTAYTEAMALHSEIGASFQTAGSSYCNHPEIKKFLEGIQQLSKSMNFIISERLKDLFDKFGSKLLLPPEEPDSFILNNNAQIPIVINEEQNSLIPKKKIRSDKIRERKDQEIHRERDRIEPPLTKKIKYNKNQILIADEPCGLLNFEDINQRERIKKTNMTITGGIKNTKLVGRGAQVSNNVSHHRDKGKTSSDVVCRQEKIKHDFVRCLYPDPVKHLILTLFDVPLNRKYLSKFINFENNSAQRIFTVNLEKAIKTLEKIQSIVLDPVQGPASAEEVSKLTNHFYSLLPLRERSALDSVNKIQKLLPIIELMSSFKITYETLKGPKTDSNQIVDHYKQLKCSIDLTDKTSTEYAVIENYFTRTCPPWDEIVIKNVYEIDRIGESTTYLREFCNRTLLWYGCRFSGVVKILKEGFKFYKDVPRSLYNSKRSISFYDRVADCFSNCQADGDNPTIMLFLCEVALGMIEDTNSLFQESSFLFLDDNVRVPNEEPNFKRPKRRYVIEDPDQVRIRYLFECNLKVKVEKDAGI